MGRLAAGSDGGEKMGTAVDQARAEIDAALVVNEELLEGAHHLAEMGDLLGGTRSDVDRSVLDYQRRNERLKDARQALKALDDDHYPDVPERPVSESALADMRQDYEAMGAALAKFESNAAATLNLEADRPVKK